HDPRAQGAVGAGVEVAHPPGRAAVDKAVDRDAHRHAGVAGAAGWTVGELMAAAKAGARQLVEQQRRGPAAQLDDQLALGAPLDIGARHRGGREELVEQAAPLRSEEHTSELQSRENLVCRLLLEKKKNQKEVREIATEQ